MESFNTLCLSQLMQRHTSLVLSPPLDTTSTLVNLCSEEEGLMVDCLPFWLTNSWISDALWRNNGIGTRPASTDSLRVCFRSSNERYENGK
ncbi:hypothetical protein Bca4012_083615 [Brassica carinata]